MLVSDHTTYKILPLFVRYRYDSHGLSLVLFLISVATGTSLFIEGTRELIAGKVVLDPTDIQDAIDDGSLENILLHEFAHVLGFGNFWNDAELVDEPSSVYVGTNGLDAWRNTIGCTTGQLPVQDNDFGHWSEECLLSELMTPSINAAETTQLSIITLRSMQDLGYEVDLGQADSFSICNIAESCTAFCPERATATCSRRLGSTNLRAITKFALSDKSEAAILEMAVAHFRKEDERKLQQQELNENDRSFNSVFSVTYKENDRYFSRVFLRRHVKNLL